MHPTNSVRLNLEELNARINPSYITLNMGIVEYYGSTGEANTAVITNGLLGRLTTLTITDNGASSINVDPTYASSFVGSGNMVTYIGTWGGVLVTIDTLSDGSGIDTFYLGFDFFLPDVLEGADPTTDLVVWI